MRPACAVLALAGCLAAFAPATLLAQQRPALTEHLGDPGHSSQSSSSSPSSSSTPFSAISRDAPKPSPAADLILQAGHLLGAGRADEAWRMLQARAADFAGDPDFDYALGLAALDSGRPGQAIFALERVLITRPDFLPARAEIARAYFMVNERENARREFAAVAAQPIPEAARRTIGRYLDAIESTGARPGPRIGLRAELDTGYDSNPNIGGSSDQWLLADGTAVIPLPASRPRSSAALGGEFALNASGPIADALDWNIGARAAVRQYASAHDFDQQQIDLSSGLTLRDGCHRYTGLALFQHLQLDGQAYRNATGGVLQWQCETDPRTLVGASLQGFRLDYPGAELRAATRTTIGLNAARLLETAGRPIVLASVSGGNERSRHGLDNLSYRFVSLRAGLVAPIASGWRLSTSLGWERRQFDAVEPIFGVTRNDRQTDLRIEIERRVDEGLSIVPYLAHTYTSSTLSPNNFRRTQAGVQFRHAF